MRAGHFVALLAVVQVATRAQQTAPPTAPEKPPAAVTPAVEAEVEAACRTLLYAPHAFRGTVRCELWSGGRGQPAPTHAFAGAWDDGLLYFELAGERSLVRGERRLVADGDGRFAVKKNPPPDCPFPPYALGKYLATGRIVAVSEVQVDGKPAVRCEVSWSNEDGALLLADLRCPFVQTPAGDDLLLSAGSNLRRTDTDRARLEGSLLLDGHRKRVLAATLRFAVMMKQAPQNGVPDPVPAAPAGLPPLPYRPVLHAIWTIEVLPPASVPMPKLDAAMLQQLEWPPSPASSSPGSR